MIGEFSDMAVRYPRAADHNNVEALRQVAQSQIDKTAKDRPVEQSAAGQGLGAQTNGENSHKTKLEQGKVIFEKYDRNGQLVLRLPPENVNEQA